MRYIMPAGLILMIVGIILSHGPYPFSRILSAVIAFPAIAFFILGFGGMGLMLYYAFTLDSSTASTNWTEQLTNILAQFCLLSACFFWCFLYVCFQSVLSVF